MILEHGVIALVNLGGSRIYFYPRGRLPPYLHAYIDAGRRTIVLRDYLVNVARGIV